MARLPVPEEDTQKRRRRGVRANLSSIKLPFVGIVYLYLRRGGLLARLVLEEGLRGATRSLATFFGHVFQLAR